MSLFRFTTPPSPPLEYQMPKTGESHMRQTREALNTKEMLSKDTSYPYLSTKQSMPRAVQNASPEKGGKPDILRPAALPTPLQSRTSTTSLGSLFAPAPTDVCDTVQRRLGPKSLVMLVGLPASGKSTVCNYLAQHLEAHDYKALIYNAGVVRRNARAPAGADFFDPQNVQAAALREQYASAAMTTLLSDLAHSRISVGFLDATNTTAARRKRMLEMALSSGVNFANIYVLDVACTDAQLLEHNIARKAGNVDYRGRSADEAVRDFRRRAAHYAQIYEPVSREEVARFGATYIRIQDAGRAVSMAAGSGDDVDQLVRSFVCDYYKNHGADYCAQVVRSSKGDQSAGRIHSVIE
ncbi:putative 6-phosphofructo-2-kinase [Clavispora lusitaniae]|uniref:6-phosphofructo-2-kinase n=1 Tax=Clavispora lusitaniae TaxID=36911 RepID=A0AA91T1W1_CLALS|nr:putative 6-phosphofructo-2-kinase [Clavispora lusitaniae]